MAEKCPICGKKIGGILVVGQQKALPDRIDFCNQHNIPVEDGICQGCLELRIAQFSVENTQKEESLYRQRKESFELVLNKFFLSPSPVPPEVQDLGLVTGYCIMGTGPISAIASSFTDAVGMKSNAYLEKVRLAETEAFNMLKIEALKKRADGVYNLRVNLTEATSGHGMIMLSVFGAAVNTGKSDASLEETWKFVAEKS